MHELTPTKLGSEAALDRLERRLARIERTLERFEEATRAAPNAVGAAVDTLDGFAAGLAARGIDVDERLRVLSRVAERLTAPEALETLEAALDRLHGLKTLLASGVLDPAPVAVIAKAAQSLAIAGGEAAPRVGAFGALRAMGQPDVQRAVGFLLRVAQLLGAALEGPRAVALLPKDGGEAR